VIQRSLEKFNSIIYFEIQSRSNILLSGHFNLEKNKTLISNNMAAIQVKFNLVQTNKIQMLNDNLKSSESNRTILKFSYIKVSQIGVCNQISEIFS
jgi:hypothetical protein